MLDVRRNRDIVRLGQETSCTYLVNEGITARYSENRRSERQATAIYLSGDTALDSVVLPDACCTLTALTDAETYCIPHAAVLAAFHSSRSLSEAIWRDMAVEASIARKWTLNISRHDAVSRIAHLLCEIGLRSVAAGEQRDEFSFPVNQEQIGDVVGLTSVHVNRVLRVIREAGLATLNRTTVKILDWPGLVLAGQFEPSYLHLHHEE